jgi:hypothetical protein
MSRKTFDDWKTLVEKQIASGLTVPTFCHQHNLNPKYFYSRKSMVYKAHTRSSFIQAQIITEKTTQVINAVEPSIKLNTVAGELSLPSNISAHFIIELIRGLSS